MRNPAQGGFTIYELLITLLIVGIVLTVGLPNLSDFVRNSRISGTVNDLHSSFLLARSEAGRAKSNITICASANSMDDAAANCDGGGLGNGWIVFVDVDGNIQRAGPDEPVLQRYPAIADTIDVTPLPAAASYFSFAPSGLGRGDVLAAPSLLGAVFCDERGNARAGGGNSAARYLAITPIGRSTVLRDVNLIDSRGGCPP